MRRLVVSMGELLRSRWPSSSRREYGRCSRAMFVLASMTQQLPGGGGGEEVTARNLAPGLQTRQCSCLLHSFLDKSGEATSMTVALDYQRFKVQKAEGAGDEMRGVDMPDSAEGDGVDEDGEMCCGEERPHIVTGWWRVCLAFIATEDCLLSSVFIELHCSVTQPVPLSELLSDDVYHCLISRGASKLVKCGYSAGHRSNLVNMMVICTLSNDYSQANERDQAYQPGRSQQPCRFKELQFHRQPTGALSRV
ncbi:hypothetical protein J6590_003925 [Homalodisca vitripennis]|nr:hypothetical protein J6590_003925 [Homalodisca vitripennis]